MSVLAPTVTRTGLYDPANEHDACGLAFVAALSGPPTHAIIQAGLTALERLDHRGAVGAEENTGDGAGLLIQMPDAFLREVIRPDLPAPGSYAAGLVFLPGAAHRRVELSKAVAAVERIAREEGLRVLAWRDVPVEDGPIGPTARGSLPTFRQLVVADANSQRHGRALDIAAFRLRRRAEREHGVYMSGLSTTTMVYKGMLTPHQLPDFFPDLRDEAMTSRLALVHSRFSTNTFPSWDLAQPFRMIAHNGEINTVRGNRNWMAARQGRLASQTLGDLSPLMPVTTDGASDSASLDEVLELLVLAGRPLPLAMAMMIPQAWENDPRIGEDLRAFYRYHQALMEPWDGPAAVTFTDGRQIGALIDRNGLRPGRWLVTEDDLVVLASETGVFDVPEDRIRSKGRLEPGQMFFVDLDGGRIIPDSEIKAGLASAAPWREWLEEGIVSLNDLPPREHIDHSHSSVLRRLQEFGYTQEDLDVVLAPMAASGAEAIGSMGQDTPLAVLSKRSRLLFDYFKELFAQVTNPPLDAIREEIVTSLSQLVGPQPNLLSDGPEHARKLALDFPVLGSDDLAKLTHIGSAKAGKGFSSRTISCLYRCSGGGEALEAALGDICAQADAAIDEGVSFLVLSDRETNAEMAPIPSLLATSAVHHHLLRRHTRTLVGLIVEAGDVREVHHVATLIGYGASAVTPYLAMEAAEELARTGRLGSTSADEAVAHLIKALGKGVLKVMSKMGISTVSSYCGAQVFQAIGLDEDFVARYFTGTPSPLGGIGIDVIAREVAERHAIAYPPSGISPAHRALDVGGEYRWRREGEEHLFTPENIARLQTATRTASREIFREYTRGVDDQSERLMTLRGLMRLRTDEVEPVPLEEVEPVSEIVKRFATGAMSFGSISREAHETMAIAMNTLGARSNSGEGGEAPERLRDPLRNSAIKQIASGRFGVTADYLSHARDIQIKMAQGAKPGEGGQLPAAKVYPWVAQERHSTPGIGLISPPPHHDIYSIEDLKQLISDLKNSNPEARVHVKLVSEVGVGTIAAGVSKARADVVLISGADGGTGAAPLTSLKHAGAPWELGIAEAQQTLVLGDLRDRIVVQADGQLKTGRDVVIAALLGAEEFGFATAPLVVSGCVMMRVCQKDTCPVGVATQNPELRERFTGKPEYIITFFTFIAEQVREILASLGLRSIDEAVGRVDLLDAGQAIDHWKASGLDLTPIFQRIEPRPGSSLHCVRPQEHGLDSVLDQRFIKLASPALESGQAVSISSQISNTDRTTGTMLGHEVALRYGDHGLAAGTIDIELTGSAGQSLGAFLPQGVSIRVFGDANDYVGKSLCGGTIALAPARRARFEAAENTIAGNVIGYGATSGELFISGRVGERFGVRNSGATLVVEGVGDHALEYMTGGEALILGPTGRNIGAGMSGGTAYILDLDPMAMNAAVVPALTFSALGDEDRERVQSLLERHLALTGSRTASDLLDAGGRGLDRFTRIEPAHYARVTELLAEADAAGTPREDAELWRTILEVSNG
ncbi:MAG: glutamate synthase large subunit [Schaalia hyovaginalis]|uniref:glutamate synthase large subunit n=1 Tax=Schaalia hyovaginalis TaxID=29316 RepID=UPI002A7FD263|nr:glutamate synthase large subunit [Schaalia hyovaginalis]MDY3665738.1 glutamate synthase large subunit [Schaalia hyovaginalis]MDY4262390.1 glutamate synthase large subunit [Schaalia hyovaginalis]